MSVAIPPQGIFISAVNTSYGKTWLSCQLLIHQSNCDAKLKSLRAIKPVQSGFSAKNNPKSDAFLLYKAQMNNGNNANLNINDVCLYSFREAIAPNQAAKLESFSYKIKDITQFCQNKINQGFCLIEGAGGLFSPIADDGLNLDIALSLKLPCILIANDTLGSISETIATQRAAKQSGVQILALVINNFAYKSSRKTKLELEKWLKEIPVLTITRNPSINEINRVSKKIMSLLVFK